MAMAMHACGQCCLSMLPVAGLAADQQAAGHDEGAEVTAGLAFMTWCID